MTPEPLVVLVALVPLGGATLNGLFGGRFSPRGVQAVAIGAVTLAFGASVMVTAELAARGPDATIYVKAFTWIAAGSLEVPLAFTVDRLSAVMLLLVTGIGALIHLFSVGYMAKDPSLHRYFAYLNLFCFAMLILVLGDSLPVLFLGWEGVGLCSYLLIGFWFRDEGNAAAGKKAFIANRIGDFGMLVAMMLLLRHTGTLSFLGLEGAVAQLSPTVLNAVALCLLLAAAGKSAQIPLYVWLPDAMAGPTPVSALIHAATMVTAGIYLVARTGFLFALAPVALVTMALIGVLTALLAASIACAQTDIKKVLAYSTISQLGFMFVAAGVGAFGVALFHVVTHAFFKACLFLGAGSLIHGLHEERDLRRMGGLRQRLPWTCGTFVAATFAITGFPLTAGFISKDLILWNAWAATFSSSTYAASFDRLGYVLWSLGLIAAGLTAFYMWRCVFLAFWSGPPRSRAVAEAHEAPASMVAPSLLLAAGSLGAGVLAWPHFLGGNEWLIEAWLAPVIGPPPVAPGGEHFALEWGLSAAATGVSLLGFAAAFFLYAREIHPLTRRFASERPWRWLHDRLTFAWHIDELYETVLLRPIRAASQFVLYRAIDRVVIDGIVNGVGRLVAALGFFPQLFHSGNIQRYIAIFAISLAVLLYGWLSPYSPPPTSPDDTEQVEP